MDLRPLPPDYLPLGIFIEPKTPTQLIRLIAALQRFASEDPTFRFHVDLENGFCRLEGTSDLHLDRKLHDLISGQGMALNIGVLQVAYREGIRHAAEIDYTHDRQAGGARQFARLRLRLEPAQGISFVNMASDAAVSHRFVASVEKGMRAVVATGGTRGFDMVDFTATLLDGAWHETDSNALAFEIAARVATREAAAKAGPIMLEPIARIEVAAMEAHIGAIIGDLNSRRAEVLGQRPLGSATIVDALIPVANLYNYFGSLQTMTDGQGSARWEAVGLAEIPGDDGDDRFRPAAAMRA